MKSWKKRWEDELEARAPVLSDEVKSARISTAQPAEKTAKKSRPSIREWISLHKRQFYSLCGAAAALVITVCAAVPALMKEQPLTLVGVQINPAVVLSVDEDGVVVSAVAANADADVILLEKSRRDQIVGKTVEDAVEQVVDFAARLGYLDLNERGGAVRLTSPDESYSLAAVEERIKAYCMAQGSYTVVLSQTLTLQQFCDDFHLKAQKTLQTLAESVTEMNVLYGYREVGASDFSGEMDNANGFYQTVVQEGITDLLSGVIGEHFEDLSAYFELMDETLILQALGALSNEETLSLLQNLGVDTAALESLYEVPQTLQEYREKIQDFYADHYAARLAKYEESYNQVRGELSKAVYNTYLSIVASMSGSLAEYWETLQALE